MPQDPLHLASISKRPFAYFLLCAGLFVTAVTAALLYGVSRPQTPVIEEQERLAVDQCWRSSQDSTQSRPSRRFQEDACREMEAQFRSKFRHGR
ncbi:hypothetical protein QFZ99_005804 [Paraburkholderia atlantica]|uniref:hypothetical protein n=1 Tax=Paraburkholderia atlantica TaxID=2654982 RepID=UPI003D1F3224